MAEFSWKVFGEGRLWVVKARVTDEFGIWVSIQEEDGSEVVLDTVEDVRILRDMLSSVLSACHAEEDGA